jgi:predicted amidohydrolase YtcJ
MTHSGKISLTILFFSILIASCTVKQEADSIYYNGKIYTVDSSFSVAEAFAVKDGKILSAGSSREIFSKYISKIKVDLKGKPVYPGFYDAHCHFFGYGSDLVKCNLYETKSFDEVVEKVFDYSKTNSFEWLLGRGWDQNDWEQKEFPHNRKLDSLFPNTPVYLVRIDGHAALCNSEALRRANITAETKVSGGIVETKNGKPTGILIDNAVDLVKEIIPAFDEAMNRKAMLTAQENCFAVGLTSVCDAGLGKDTIELIEKMQQENLLKMRINAMVADNGNNAEYFFKRGKIKTERLHVSNVKVYCDGALGSRGACLIEEYSDKPGHHGFLLHDTVYLKKVAEQCYKHGFQMSTHCIGDSGVRTMMKIYGEALKGKNELRWRIEHCQVVHPDDLPLFEKFSIIPSVQPTHATSDMYWAGERLGKERVRSSYAYQDLLKQNNLIAFGTDFPVENISPVHTFYAAVVRKDLKNYPDGGFQPENKVSRENALRAMTTWAAYSCFEEKEKGMIAPGMFADFIILSEDIMANDENKIPSVTVEATYLSGEKVYQK